MISYWWIPWPLWATLFALLAIAIHLVVRWAIGRHAHHPLIPFLAGVLVGALFITAIIPRGTAT